MVLALSLALSLSRSLALSLSRLSFSRELAPPWQELVLAADTCNTLLPGTIEAVYMLPHTTITVALEAEKKRVRERRHGKVWPPRSAEDDARLARVVHAQLLRHFNLTAQQLPLLELNISDRVAPFRLSTRLTGPVHEALIGIQAAHTETEVWKVVSTLAYALGTARAETGTIRALHAVLIQMMRPGMSDVEAQTSTGASVPNFRLCKRRLQHVQ